MYKPKDITNQKFGMLTALSLIPYEERKNHNKLREWKCLCDCGNYTIVEQRHLTTKSINHIRSCGCLRAKAHLMVTSKCEWITLDYINSFMDWDRFAFLHKSLIRFYNLQQGLTEEYYKQFIERFYNDKQFMKIYNIWQEGIKEEGTFYDWHKPSIDHIIPLSRGGTNDIQNLQFLTVYENLNKRDMTEQEWNDFKQRTHTTSDLFVRG